MSVYFAQVGHYIKIGYSANPERRVRNLFKSTTRYGAPADCPTDIASRHLIRAIDGTKDDEGRIHRALSDYCVGLEWYADEPALRDYIANVEQTDDEYPVLTRLEGPVRASYDEADLSDESAALLAQALSTLFPPHSLRGGVPPTVPAA